MDKDLELIKNMKNNGGSFVKALANCLLKADIVNYRKLINTFPDYVKIYSNWTNKES